MGWFNECCTFQRREIRLDSFTFPHLLVGTQNFNETCSLLFADRNSFLYSLYYEGWNFNSGNYLFTTDTK